MMMYYECIFAVNYTLQEEVAFREQYNERLLSARCTTSNLRGSHQLFPLNNSFNEAFMEGFGGTKIESC